MPARAASQQARELRPRLQGTKSIPWQPSERAHDGSVRWYASRRIELQALSGASTKPLLNLGKRHHDQSRRSGWVIGRTIDDGDGRGSESEWLKAALKCDFDC